jgi:hypothetical protein
MENDLNAFGFDSSSRNSSETLSIHLSVCPYVLIS